MTENEFWDLIDRYTKGECTPAEEAKVLHWYVQISDQLNVSVTKEELAAHKAKTRAHITGKAAKRLFPQYFKYAAAAVVLIGICTTLYLKNVLFYPKKEVSTNLISTILPGSNKATLTLADGRVVNLQDTHPGSVATVAGVEVTVDKSKNSVTYRGSKTGGNYNRSQSGQGGSNIISVPKGGQYQLILPDGSHVYLNAASDLQFPTRFAAHSREVTLTGEAYFEINKDPKSPFMVRSGGQKLTVLGTHFNISAYPGEIIKTTLAEGSVQLSSSSTSLQKQLLKPDQQATLLSTGYQVKTVNAAEQIAWKDGIFLFKETPIAEVLQQLSRWYNVETDLNGLPNVTVTAGLSKALTLQELLSGLEFTSGITIQLTKERRLKFIN